MQSPSRQVQQLEVIKSVLGRSVEIKGSWTYLQNGPYVELYNEDLQMPKTKSPEIHRRCIKFAIFHYNLVISNFSLVFTQCKISWSARALGYLEAYTQVNTVASLAYWTTVEAQRWREHHGIEAQVVLGLQVLLVALLSAAGIPPLVVAHHQRTLHIAQVHLHHSPSRALLSSPYLQLPSIHA